MRISGTGNKGVRGIASNLKRASSPRDRQRGFSLVEVLVTLSVTALAASLIVMTARPADPLKQEAERLEKTLDQLSERARVSGTPTGLIVKGNAYVPAHWAGGAWQSADEQRHELGEALTLVLSAPHADRPALVFDPLFPAPSPDLIIRHEGRELWVRGAP